MQLTSVNESSDNVYQLTVTDLSGVHHFQTGSIIRMEANDNYTILYLQNRRPFVVSKVLKIYEEMLKPFGFIRTHRSHLVNVQFVERVEKSSIIMQDASVAEISRRKTKSIQQILKRKTVLKTA